MANNLSIELEKIETLTQKRNYLLSLMREANDAISSIKSQIRKTQRQGKVDQGWLKRAKTSLKIKGETLNTIQVELSLLRCQHKKKMETAFINICERKLPKDLFKSILDEAMRSAGVN